MSRRAGATLLVVAVVSLATCSGAVAAAEGRKPRAIIHYDAQGNVARQEIDTAGAGRVNLWVYYEGGQMVRQEEDTVGDGKPHVWSFFQSGRLARQEVDRRGQGRPDVWYELDATGTVVRKSEDTTGRGRRDLVVEYQGGVPARSEQDLDGDGQPDRVLVFTAGRLARLEEATRRDSRIDLWVMFDDKGERVR